MRTARRVQGTSLRADSDERPGDERPGTPGGSPAFPSRGRPQRAHRRSEGGGLLGSLGRPARGSAVRTAARAAPRRAESAYRLVDDYLVPGFERVWWSPSLRAVVRFVVAQRASVSANERSLRTLLGLRRRDLRSATAWALLTYAVLAVALYLPVQPLSSSQIVVCGCFDPGGLTWSIGWTPFALLHHQNPFLSYWLDYPVGVNMATNPMMPLLGIIAAPVTLSLGPIAAFNLLFRLAFLLSAAAMFFCLRRFVASQWAAYVGGLLYGFSPYMLNQGDIHLSLVFVPIPPLILAALHDLFVAPRHSARRTGVVLGVLCAAQYLIAQEILADTVTLAVVGVVLVVLANPAAALRTARFRLSGLAWSLLVFGALCGYPIWFELFGPQHLPAGAPFGALTTYASDLLSPIVPTNAEHFAPASLVALGKTFAGGDAAENDGYIGITWLLACIVTVIVARKDAVIRFCTAMALTAFVVSLGQQLVIHNHWTSIYLPYNVMRQLPLLDSETPVRFSLFEDLFLAVVLAAGLDMIASWGARTPDAPPVGPGLDGNTPPAAESPATEAWTGPVAELVPVVPGRRQRLRTAVGRRAGAAWRWVVSPRRSRLAALAAALVTVAVLVPLFPSLPLDQVPSQVPTAFLDSPTGRSIPAGSVALTYPYDTPSTNYAMLWAASAGFRFKLIGGYDAIPTPNDGGDPWQPPALQPDAIFTLFGAAWSGSKSALPPFDRATFVAFRTFCSKYDVSEIIYDTNGGLAPQVGVTYLEAAFGRPQFDGRIDYWGDVQRRLHAPLPRSPSHP